MNHTFLLRLLFLVLPFLAFGDETEYDEEKVDVDSEEAFTLTKEWKNRVYLASFPRSGNHWARYLIEEATHIATGSIYPDSNPPHFKEPFPWGGYCTDHGYRGNCRYPRPGELVVVKTHHPVISPKFSKLPAVKTIRIVRHPVDAFYSWYVFKNKKNIELRIPSAFLKESIAAFRKFQKYWDRQPHVVTFRYEDLYDNPRLYLKKILNAIGYQVTEADIKRAIAKNPPRGGLLKHSHHFHKNDIDLISYELKYFIRKYNYKIPSF